MISINAEKSLVLPDPVAMSRISKEEVAVAELQAADLVEPIRSSSRIA